MYGEVKSLPVRPGGWKKKALGVAAEGGPELVTCGSTTLGSKSDPAGLPDSRRLSGC